jgi:hypothetical protein
MDEALMPAALPAAQPRANATTFINAEAGEGMRMAHAKASVSGNTGFKLFRLHVSRKEGCLRRHAASQVRQERLQQSDSMHERLASTKGQQVGLGDGLGNTPIVGECSLPLRLQAYRGKLRTFVLESLLPGVDLVLGDTWLRSYGAQLEYRQRRVMFYTKGRLVRLQPIRPSATSGLKPPSKENRGSSGAVYTLVPAATICKDLRRAAR